MSNIPQRRRVQIHPSTENFQFANDAEVPLTGLVGYLQHLLNKITHDGGDDVLVSGIKDFRVTASMPLTKEVLMMERLEAAEARSKSLIENLTTVANSERFLNDPAARYLLTQIIDQHKP